MKIFKLNRDLHLVERIRNNDRRILGELYNDNFRLTVNYITRNGGTADDARSMLHEAIIVLWQNVNAGGFQLSSKLSTYLLGIIRNKWFGELRKQQRFSDEAPNPGNERSSDPTPEKEFEINERNRLIREALNRIDQTCRQLLLLFYFEEKSMEVIAGEMGFANVNTAKSKKYQCKKRLEEVYKKITLYTGGLSNEL